MSVIVTSSQRRDTQRHGRLDLLGDYVPAAQTPYDVGGFPGQATLRERNTVICIDHQICWKISGLPHRMYALAVLLVLSGPAHRLVPARGESHAATAGDSHYNARGESHAGESHHAPAGGESHAATARDIGPHAGESHHATRGELHATRGESQHTVGESHTASVGELGHIGPEDWLRNFTNATEQRDYEKLQHLLTYVVEKAGDKTLDQDILASLKAIGSIGAVGC
ncbi:hypothetical protein Bbelb_108050 [Branchiostoma belcheri]|nr:hypothetical protein Bbelb_108050 [Branchiostoma belcheri]